MRQVDEGQGTSALTIAHLLPWPSLGGVEIATIRLIATTAHLFRHVTFCIRGSADLIAACEGAGASVVEYTPPEPSLRHFPRFRRESERVAEELRRSGAQIAHCSETKAAYHNSLAALMARVPLITHVRSRYSTVPFRERLTLLPVKRYVFVSEDSRRQFAVKVPDRKASVLYDAVAVPDERVDVAAVREELGLASGAPVVGMVARVNPQKDYFTLAEAAVKVLERRPETRFVVVGDNAEVELNRRHYGEVRARLQQMGIEASFLFTGFRSDIPRLVAAMDVFVLSTHREGLPLSILEGMGMGKAVVATAVDGIPEVITDGVTGLLHAHQDSEGLAAAILECIEDPAKARAMGEAARELVRTKYNPEVYAENVERIYREVLGRAAERSAGAAALTGSGGPEPVGPDSRRM
ncbi:MAG TPA: glycosyltransferase [Acidobacteriaceae bacterium]|jgi:glycosyltransferase involved in cell wall biosynthesis|nr:glycosyltransferase [Acidobacteriaceae bacterium]